MFSKLNYILGPVFFLEKQNSREPMLFTHLKHDGFGVSLDYFLHMLKVFLVQEASLSDYYFLVLRIRILVAVVHSWTF